MDKKLRVAILGATGMVGQRFIDILGAHPWFETAVVAASPRSAGRTYEEAVEGRWKMDRPIPESVRGMVLKNVEDVDAVAADVDFVLSAVAMGKDEIKAIEERYARTETPVVSNNSAHRWTPDVPMIIPEINPEHAQVIEPQKKRLGTERGFIAVKPNCSIHRPHSLEEIRADRDGGDHLSGHIRRGQELRRVAGDGGQCHTLHIRRGGEVGEGASAHLGPRGGHRDSPRHIPCDHLPVHTHTCPVRTYGGLLRPL